MNKHKLITLLDRHYSQYTVIEKLGNIKILLPKPKDLLALSILNHFKTLLEDMKSVSVIIKIAWLPFWSNKINKKKWKYKIKRKRLWRRL